MEENPIPVQRRAIVFAVIATAVAVFAVTFHVTDASPPARDPRPPAAPIVLQDVPNIPWEIVPRTVPIPRLPEVRPQASPRPSMEPDSRNSTSRSG